MTHTLHKTFFATLLAMFSLLANAHDFEAGGIFYNITSSTDYTVAVTFAGDSYDSYSDEYTGVISIPASVTYNGITFAVTTIGSSAFSGCTSLTSVTIPNSVTSIGTAAFQG